VGERLVHDPRVRGVSFTGSQAVGAGVAAGLAARFGRAQLEMGGKNPLVVLDDADLDVAVDCAVQGAFFQTGQRCTASSRLIVTAGIHDRFVDATIERMRALRVGNALADDTQIGPVVSADQFQQDLDYLEIGDKEGAALAFGGAQLERDTEGYYLELKHAAMFRDGLQAGIVAINLPTAGVDHHVPFGGTKGSSSGPREQGRYAVEFFTTVKTTYTRP